MKTQSFLSVLLCFLIEKSLGQDENCGCTLYYLCDAQNTVSSTKCSGPEVCCRAGDVSNPVVTAIPVRTTTPRSGLPKDVTDPPNSQDSQCDCIAAAECPEVSGANQLDIRLGKTCPKNQVCCPRSGNSGGGNTGGDNGGGNTGGDNGGGNNGGGNHGGTGGGNTGGDGTGGFGGDEFQQCGVRRDPNKQFTFRITGSKSEQAETFFGEYPWMMAILTNRNNPDGSVTENVFQCGASLILPHVVMTAAHCVNNIPVGDIKVRGGEWDTISNNKTEREPFAYQERTVSQVLIHDQFDVATVYNDIALLMLDFPFEVKDHIGQVCTPNSVQEYDENICLVTGWGKDKFGKEGKYQNILRKVDLKLVPRNVCQQKLRQTRLGGKFKLHESFICAAGSPTQDACKGDGGGPLICKLRNENNRYTQVGIVAWGIGCGSDTPGVYVDVHKYKKWILDNSHGQTINTRIKTKN